MNSARYILLILGWIQDYRSKWPDPSCLQAEIDDYLMQFEEQVAKKQEEAAKQGQPDEESWITVTRNKKGLKPGERSRADLRQAKKKRKQKVKLF